MLNGYTLHEWFPPREVPEDLPIAGVPTVALGVF